jgi:hypothetical protein
MSQAWIATVITASILMAACSSQSSRPEPEEIFTTTITDDGSKIFVYALISPKSANRPQKGRDGSGRGGRGGKGGGGKRMAGVNGSRQADLSKNLEKGLDEKLATTGFCREGYLELDHYQSRGQSSIRGECHDPASAEDRVKFQAE